MHHIGTLQCDERHHRRNVDEATVPLRPHRRRVKGVDWVQPTTHPVIISFSTMAQSLGIRKEPAPSRKSANNTLAIAKRRVASNPNVRSGAVGVVDAAVPKPHLTGPTFFSKLGTSARAAPRPKAIINRAGNSDAPTRSSLAY